MSHFEILKFNSQPSAIYMGADISLVIQPKAVPKQEDKHVVQICTKKEY